MDVRRCFLQTCDLDSQFRPVSGLISDGKGQKSSPTLLILDHLAFVEGAPRLSNDLRLPYEAVRPLASDSRRLIRVLLDGSVVGKLGPGLQNPRTM
jgi:hypothetical protein